MMGQTRAMRNSSRLVRLMITNWVFGWAIGFVGAAAVLASNMAGIRDLMFKSDIMWQALALLFCSFGFTFGGVVCATAVMLLPIEETESGRGGGHAAPVFLPAYALARVRKTRC
jgi:hypothetical protein